MTESIQITHEICFWQAKIAQLCVTFDPERKKLFNINYNMLIGKAFVVWKQEQTIKLCLSPNKKPVNRPVAESYNKTFECDIENSHHYSIYSQTYAKFHLYTSAFFLPMLGERNRLKIQGYW